MFSSLPALVPVFPVTVTSYIVAPALLCGAQLRG
jgi:hypothetical protein